MDTDTRLIEAAVHDYFDGYFTCDAVRMARALHRDFVKRSPGDDEPSTLQFITAEQMVEWTAEGLGVEVAGRFADRSIKVEVLDMYDDIASVVVRSEPYHEYLHLVRTREGWKIANALYRRVGRWD